MPNLVELTEACVRELAEQHIHASRPNRTAEMRRLYLAWSYGEERIGLPAQASQVRLQKALGIHQATVHRMLKLAEVQMEEPLRQARTESMQFSRYQHETEDEVSFKIPGPDKARDDAFTDTTQKKAWKRIGGICNSEAA